MIDKKLLEMPLMFTDNRITRFYIGGSVLSKWRRMPIEEDKHQCEELLCTSIGAISKGMPEGYAISKTIESQGSYSLKEIIAQYPEEVLGSEYQKYNPNQLSVLARVGDTKVRLVLQCHPKKEDAQKYFKMPMGKTEAWYMARVRDNGDVNPCVYVGFKKGVTKELWKELYLKQDVKKMLDCLHCIPVSQGDTILVPAGTVHACGPNCLFLEYHECNDITVRLEKNINGMTISDEEMFYGLSIDEGLGLFDYTTYTFSEALAKFKMSKKQYDSQGQCQAYHLITEKENDSFGIDLIDIDGNYRLPDKNYHRVIVAVDNDVQIKVNGNTETLVQGHAALVSACCKNIELIGQKAKVTIGIPYLNGKEVA